MAMTVQSSGCSRWSRLQIQIGPDKVKTYHINMLKRYFYREGVAPPQDNRSQPTQVGEVVNETTVDSDGTSIDQGASIACKDEEIGDDVAAKDEATLHLYNFKQKWRM